MYSFLFKMLSSSLQQLWTDNTFQNNEIIVICNIFDQLVGKMTGAIRDLEVDSEDSSSEDEVEESTQPSPKKATGMFSIFKGEIFTSRFYNYIIYTLGHIQPF